MTTSQSTHGGATPSGKTFCSLCLAEIALELSESALSAAEFEAALRFAEVAFLFGRASTAAGDVCRRHAPAPSASTGGGRQ
jgi:hypothetical protein